MNSNNKVKINTNVPIFLWKLWSLVSDPKIDSYVHWSENGDSFVIEATTEFSRDVLPMYFKHNNFASFVRQLNLYGFKKVVDIQQGMFLDKSASRIEFQNPFFQRGQEQLLEHVKRKQLNTPGKRSAGNGNMVDTYDYIQSVCESHREVSEQLGVLKEQNDRIWMELIALRQRHDRQSNILEKLINFFAAFFRPYHSDLSNILINNDPSDNPTVDNNLQLNPISHTLQKGVTNTNSIMQSPFNQDLIADNMGVSNAVVPSIRQPGVLTESIQPQSMRNMPSLSNITGTPQSKLLEYRQNMSRLYEPNKNIYSQINQNTLPEEINNTNSQMYGQFNQENLAFDQGVTANINESSKKVFGTLDNSYNAATTQVNNHYVNLDDKCNIIDQELSSLQELFNLSGHPSSPSNSCQKPSNYNFNPTDNSFNPNL